MKNKIDHIGMWTWGGRVYNWKKYLDNMHRSGMDTVVLWHTDKPPVAAREIQDYGRALGIKVVWGFNWSWNSPICLNCEEDSARWVEIITKLVREHYAPLNSDGLCFQVGGTEYCSGCRLDCDVCRDAREGGIAPLFVKFAGPIMDAVRAQWPDTKIFANLHCSAAYGSYDALKVLDPAINIMWEDLPGPGTHMEVPFAYEWASDDSDLQASTLDMVKRMCELRGDAEDVSFVIKGFPCHWGGEDPSLMENFDLEVLTSLYRPKWDEAAEYCVRKLDQAMKVFRVIAESPAKSKTVLLLVEHGLWEYRRYFAAELIAEAARNPFREPHEVLKIVKELQCANIE